MESENLENLENIPHQSTILSDLKERRLVQYVGAYIALSFGIVQFAMLAEDRYGWPSSFVDKIVLFFVALLPAVILFTYHHGRPGHDSWKPIEKIFIPLNILIALLLSIFAFNGNSVAQTEVIKIAQEDGTEVEHMVATKAYSNRLLVFPFQHSDAVKEWEAIATSYLLDLDLEQDSRIYSNNLFSLKEDFNSYGLELQDDMSISQSFKIANDNYADYFVKGHLSKEGDNFVLDTKMYSAESEDIFFEQIFSAGNIYDIVDELSSTLNTKLYLSDTNEGFKFIDVPAREIVSKNDKAVETFIIAELLKQTKPDQPGLAHQQAVVSTQEDDRCALCWETLAETQHQLGLGDEARGSFRKSSQLADALPERTKLRIKHRNYLVNDEPHKADQYSEVWRKKFPYDYEPYSDLFTMYRAKMDFNKAKQVALEAIDKEHYTMYLSLARLCIGLGDLEEGETYLKKFIEIYPDKSAELLELGSLYERQGKHDEAITHYKDILLVDEDNRDAMIALADAYGVKGDFKNEYETLQEAFEYSKSPMDSVSIYGFLVRHFTRQGLETEVFEHLQQQYVVWEKSTPRVGILQYAAMQNIQLYANFQRFEDHTDVVNEFLTYLPAEQKDNLKCVIDCNLGIMSDNLLLFERAVEKCEAFLLKWSGESGTSFIAAEGHRLKGESEKAIALYKEMGETGTNTDLLWSRLIEPYLDLGQLDEGEALIDKVLKSHPSNTLALYYKTQILKRQNKNAEAKKTFASAMDILKNASKNYIPFIKLKSIEAEI